MVENLQRVLNPLHEIKLAKYEKNPLVLLKWSGMLWCLTDLKQKYISCHSSIFNVNNWNEVDGIVARLSKGAFKFIEMFIRTII